MAKKHTNYTEAVFEFLKAQYRKEPLRFFTTITLMGELITMEDRNKLYEKVSNISKKMQATFEAHIEPLVLEGIVEKAIICSQGWNRSYRPESTAYRLTNKDSSNAYQRYLADQSLNSAML